jgi:hypothetical protein
VARAQAEDVAFAVHVHADRDVYGAVGYLAVADLDHQGVDQQHRVDAAVQGPGLPGDHVIEDLIGDLRDRLPGDLGVVDLRQMRLDLPRRQALRVEADHVRTQALQAAHVLGDRDRLKRPSRSLGTRKSTGPTSVLTVFA